MQDVKLTPRQAESALSILRDLSNESVSPARIEELATAEESVRVIIEQATERGTLGDEIVQGLESELPDDMLHLALDHIAEKVG